MWQTAALKIKQTKKLPYSFEQLDINGTFFIASHLVSNFLLFEWLLRFLFSSIPGLLTYLCCILPKHSCPNIYNAQSLFLVALKRYGEVVSVPLFYLSFSVFCLFLYYFFWLLAVERACNNTKLNTPVIESTSIALNQNVFCFFCSCALHKDTFMKPHTTLVILKAWGK